MNRSQTAIGDHRHDNVKSKTDMVHVTEGDYSAVQNIQLQGMLSVGSS